MVEHVPVVHDQIDFPGKRPPEGYGVVGEEVMPAPPRLGPVDAGKLPHYSVHAAGGEAAYIVPAANLTLNFEYEHEYAAHSHTLGNTIVFGGTWTSPYPKTPTK